MVCAAEIEHGWDKHGWDGEAQVNGIGTIGEEAQTNVDARKDEGAEKDMHGKV